MSKLGIIIIGASGRMGRTIIELIKENPAFALAGAVENNERLSALAGLDCPISDTLANILPVAPNSVIIDFTAPQASLAAAETAARHGAPIVIGTTGLDESQKETLKNLAKSSPILWSANMSVGVNVLMHFLPMLTQALGSDYDVEMMEIHHRRKKDAPSGTALMLGDAVAMAKGWRLAETRKTGRNGITGERISREIGIQALRGGDVVGIHTVYFLGPGELIEISHQAESRENFAQGALRAAAWLAGKNGGRLYSMQDVITGLDDAS